MFHLVRFRELAAYPSGHPQHGTALTGAEAYRCYSKESAPVLARVGGSIVYREAVVHRQAGC